MTEIVHPRAQEIEAIIEAIKELKVRYWYCVDNKLWQELADCFAEDAVADYPNGKRQGRGAVAEFLQRTLGRGPVIHKGQNPEIVVTGDTLARGTWEAIVSMTDARTGSEVEIQTFYEDEYCKEQGKWKIRSTSMRVVPAEGSKQDGQTRTP